MSDKSLEGQGRKLFHHIRVVLSIGRISFINVNSVDTAGDNPSQEQRWKSISKTNAAQRKEPGSLANRTVHLPEKKPKVVLFPSVMSVCKRTTNWVIPWGRQFPTWASVRRPGAVVLLGSGLSLLRAATCETADTLIRHC